MQTRNDRCAPCYGRRAVLGLAFAPFIDRPSALATSRLIRYASIRWAEQDWRVHSEPGIAHPAAEARERVAGS